MEQFLFQNAYFVAKGKLSREQIIAELNELGASDVLKMYKLANDYHNLKVYIRSKFRDVQELEKYFEENSARSISELAELEVCSKAVEKYKQTQDARDIDLILEEDFFKEREKITKRTKDKLLREIYETEKFVYWEQRKNREKNEQNSVQAEKLAKLIEKSKNELMGQAPLYVRVMY